MIQREQPMDKQTPEYWLTLKPEDVVTLRDPQTLELLAERGEDPGRGMDFVARRVLDVTETNGSMRWLLCEMESGECDLVLVAKIVDGELSLGVYYEPGDFVPGTRQDMLERGCGWLFDVDEEPADQEGGAARVRVPPGGLGAMEYARQMTQELGDGRVVCFRMKRQGPLYGTCSETPKPTGVEEVLAAVVEYDTRDACDDPELLVLELGDDEDGGHIRLFEGCGVGLGDVDVLRQEV